jgi:hypothetical protein
VIWLRIAPVAGEENLADNSMTVEVEVKERLRQERRRDAMDTMTLRAFFMWCTIINGALLILSFLICAYAGGWIHRMHSKWFPIPRETFNVAIYCFNLMENQFHSTTFAADAWLPGNCHQTPGCSFRPPNRPSAFALRVAQETVFSLIGR